MTATAYVVTIDSPGLAPEQRRFAAQTLKDAAQEISDRIGERPVTTTDNYGDPHGTLSIYLEDQEPLEDLDDGETVTLPDGSTVTVTVVAAPDDWHHDHDNVWLLASWLIEQGTFEQGVNGSTEDALRNLNSFHEKPYQWTSEYALWVATGLAEDPEGGQA